MGHFLQQGLQRHLLQPQSPHQRFANHHLRYRFQLISHMTHRALFTECL